MEAEDWFAGNADIVLSQVDWHLNTTKRRKAQPESIINVTLYDVLTLRIPENIPY